MKKSSHPNGWDEDHVRRVIEHYESQTDSDAAEEDDGALDKAVATVTIPVELVSVVRELIAKHNETGSSGQ